MKILAFAGSTRTDSLNKKLVKVAAKGAEAAGATVTYIDLRDYPLPLYDGDVEAAGFPENALKLKKIFGEHDGFLIASPEYNSGMSGVLKNTIDWVSRPVEGEKSLQQFRGKSASVMSAAPGSLGGLRGLYHLRWVLANIHVLVLTNQVAVPKAFSAFDETGNLKDEKVREKVLGLGRQLTETLQRTFRDQ